jgi:hypothetical protein
MNKKTAYIIFTAVFFAVCLIPSVGMLIIGPSDSSANEILAEQPVLFTPDGSFNTSITDDITSYIADRFAFRQQFITAYAHINAAIFHESTSDDVIIGKEGMLFYAKTMDDYLHRNTLSSRSINGIARTLSMIQAYSEQQGTEFVFTIAPNKNSLYGEYMPDVGTQFNTEKNIDMLVKAIKRYDIKYADLTAVLSQTQTDELLYHKLDSHWTNHGAAIAYQTISESLGIEPHNWTDEPYSIVSEHEGDLYKMLYPTGKKLDDNAVYDRKFDFDYDGPADAIRIDSNSSASNSLLMFRDSFGNALYPFFADSFGTATFSRLNPYRIDWLDNGSYDYMVIEIVERNINWLASKAPVMPAPEISSLLYDSKVTYSDEVEYVAVTPSQDMSGYTVFSGSYDTQGTDEDTPVYLAFSDSAGSMRIFEACPTGSDFADKGNDGCFTAYIPSEISDSCDVSLLLSGSGGYISKQLLSE